MDNRLAHILAGSQWPETPYISQPPSLGPSPGLNNKNPDLFNPQVLRTTSSININQINLCAEAMHQPGLHSFQSFETNSTHAKYESLQNSQDSRRMAPTQATTSTNKKTAIDAFAPKSLLFPVNFAIPPGLPSLEELMKLDAVELCMKAKEKSKKNVSQDDNDYFLALYRLWEKVIAINAIHRGVSVDMVHTILGKFKRMRDRNPWNEFQKSSKSSTIFKEENGVQSGIGMKKVAAEWKKLTDLEKKSFKPQTDNVNITLSAQDREEDLHNNRVSVVVNDTAASSVKSRSLENCHGRVTRWLANWQKEANCMAATECCEFVIVGASRHLGSNGFQMVRATPGATSWLEHQNATDPQHTVAASIQAFITGTAVGLICAPAHVGKKSPRKREAIEKARTAMNTLIKRHSNGLHQKWPWTNCEEKLALWGYKLTFKDDFAALLRDCITRPNRALVDEDAARIHTYVTSSAIVIEDLDPREVAMHRAKRQKCSKRKENGMASEGSETAKFTSVINETESEDDDI